jgi:hypothetical protein
MFGCVNTRLEAGRSVVGDETKDSRFTHSVISAWMPAESCVARLRMYAQTSAPSQNGSFMTACCNAGRMCGSGGSVLSSFGGSSCVGVATLAVLSRLAAMVRRIWLSVLKVAVTTHAGHPRVRHQSCSSVMKHCRPMNALRASPAKASSRSDERCVQSAALASADAREKRATTGMMRAWRISR